MKRKGWVTQPTAAPLRSDDVDAQLKALADPTRRTILRLVRDEERTVNEIAAEFAVSRPAISQHLKVLSDAGLVTVRREATRRWYRSSPERIDEVRQWLGDFWAHGLEELKRAAEQEEWPERARRQRS